MIAELGHFALLLSLGTAIVLGTVPLAGAQLRFPQWIALAPAAAWGQFLMLAIAYAALTHSFVAQDFSVAYVAQNSNSALPLFYRISAVWGAHEGSILLWALILAAWTAAVSRFSRDLPSVLRARVLAVLGLVSTGFLLFILQTSNPFERLVPGAVEGHDLNPLLQDPGMIIHPPMLYMGYVGLAVPFAFAVASLLGGRIDAAWTRWTRPWTTVAWVFLTLGIALGSWWAYYELGWGGWWFWDPVENASFMPWLVATALLHSLAVTEQRGAFKAWTVLLAIFGFSLSLLGTFLVRSGVLVSVHAFATDPERGTFILAFLVLVIGAALLLYAWRAPAVSGGGQFSLFSRETLLLINNVALVVACATVLLGTLYPLVVDGLGLGKISVGPPYFDAVFIPLMVPVALLIGIAPILRWKSDQPRRIAARLWPFALISVLTGTVLFWLTSKLGIVGAIAVMFAVWIILSTGHGIWHRMRPARGNRDKANGWRMPWRTGRAFLGMSLAHLGMAVTIIGITAVSLFSEERDLLMMPGEATELRGYRFVFKGVEDRQGPNFRAQTGTIEVYSDGQLRSVLHPEKRTYLRQQQPMTEAAIDPRLDRDLYVALGEARDGSAWSVRIHYKSGVRLIWLGAIFMAVGGLVAVSDRRYRLGRGTRRTSQRDGLSGPPDARPAAEPDNQTLPAGARSRA